MRKKLMLLSVLTCVAGGSALAAPATARDGYPDCDQFRGTACSTPGATMICQWEGRYMDGLYCWNGTWE
ncbi:MAG TPA: hypothetical protein VF263_14785 [Longimicrobiaceae bacterium]